MKPILCVLLSAMAAALSLRSNAQDSIAVEVQKKQMSLGTHPAYVVWIPQARIKDVVNAWKKYIRRGDTKNSVELSEEEYSIRASQFVNVSPVPMNVYSTVKDEGGKIVVSAWFTEDDTVFISQENQNEKSVPIIQMMKDFGRAQYRLAVEREVNDEEENLKKLEREKEDLINANESASKNISELERKINKAKNDIETNDDEQIKLRSAVANQKEIVRSTTPKTETHDLEQKKLSNLEKDLKKLEREGENYHSSIDGWNADIRQQQRNIEKNEEMIKEKKESISRQKEKVKEVTKKLENI